LKDHGRLRRAEHIGMVLELTMQATSQEQRVFYLAADTDPIMTEDRNHPKELKGASYD